MAVSGPLYDLARAHSWALTWEGVKLGLDGVRAVSASAEVGEMVDVRMKALRDQATRLERARQEGFQQGFLEGFREGFQEGFQEARREVAQRMLEAGIGPETIVDMTGIRPEDPEA